MHATKSSGYVLIGVLLLLLAVTGLGNTLLVMSRSEFFVSRARWNLLTRRFAAEAGLNIAARSMTGTDSLPRGEWVPMGSGTVPPRGRYDARVVRLSREVLLVHSEGASGTEPGRYGQVGLYWAMDPVARVSAARGIVESGGGLRIEAGSSVDSNLIRRTPDGWPQAACERFRPDVNTLFIDGPLPAEGELHEDPRVAFGREQGSGGPGERGTGSRLPSLGLLGHDALMRGAGPLVFGTVSPAPIRQMDRCAEHSPTNWGAPLDVASPCAQYRPVVAAEGSLTVMGGRGQGVLLIPGDAVFRSAARYYGLVVVGGDLEITDGSEIYGLVRVRGSVRVRGRSRIAGSACAALLALDAARKLRSPASMPGDVWPDSH